MADKNNRNNPGFRERIPDELLMKRITTGDESAFAELYQRYSRRMLVYFSRMMNGDEATAQDLLQTLFLKVVEKPELFDARKSFATWIFTAASNLCKNEYRRRKIRMDFARTAKYKPAEDPAEATLLLEKNEFRDAVLKKLHRLDANHRNIFLLRYQENLSIREIAEIMNCPQGTIKSRLHYAARLLAGALQNFNPRRAEEIVDEKSQTS